MLVGGFRDTLDFKSWCFKDGQLRPGFFGFWISVFDCDGFGFKGFVSLSNIDTVLLMSDIGYSGNSTNLIHS
jgi:hypothetical protein